MYISDTLRLICENTAKAVPEGSYLPSRYADIISPEQSPQESEQTAQEVIDTISLKLAMMGGDRNKSA